MTESELRAPKARLARLGPILIPLVMPPKPAEIAFASPRRTRSLSSPALSSPGRLASFAHSSASMEAIKARASALEAITGSECSRGSAIGRQEKSPNTVRIAALAVSGPKTGPSQSPKTEQKKTKNPNKENQKTPTKNHQKKKKQKTPTTTQQQKKHQQKKKSAPA